MTTLLMAMFFSSLAYCSEPANFFYDLENFKNKNLGMQTEKENLEATSNNLLSKRLFWTPKLSVSAEKSETKINSVKTYEGDSLNADLNLNLFRGGSDWNQMKGARSQNKAQELQVLNESLRVEIRASDLLFKSLYIIESERIEGQLLKLKEESLKIVKDRYSQGKLPLQEVTKSEVDLVQQRNKLRNAGLDLKENRSQITSLFIDEVKTQEWPFSEKTIPKLVSSSRIPQVEQKFWQSEASEELWRAARGAHWPSLDLRVQYQTSPIDERKNKQWVGLISFTLPIWSQFETAANASSAYAKYISALNEYKETDQSLQQRNLFLKEKIEVSRQNLSESKKNLEIARKLYEDILRSFRLGRISTNDLILEQNRLLESENTLAASQLAFHQSLIETCALIGLKSAECLE